MHAHPIRNTSLATLEPIPTASVRRTSSVHQNSKLSLGRKIRELLRHSAAIHDKVQFTSPLRKGPLRFV